MASSTSPSDLPSHAMGHHTGAVVQTTSKFPFRWWGINSTLPGKHQLRRPSKPYSPEEAALDASESRDENSGSYADSTRSASFPTDGNKIMTRFAVVMSAKP
jgi:hypothetical protein